MLRNAQFAAGMAEPAQDENLRHYRPRYIFLALQHFTQKGVQTQVSEHLQTQPRTTKLAATFNVNATDVYLLPLGPRRWRQLLTWLEQRALPLSPLSPGYCLKLCLIQ